MAGCNDPRRNQGICYKCTDYRHCEQKVRCPAWDVLSKRLSEIDNELIELVLEREDIRQEMLSLWNGADVLN